MATASIINTMVEHPLNTREVKRTVRSFQGDLLTLIDTMVAINSHSNNHAGLARVAEVVERALPASLNLERVTGAGGENVWMCRQGPAEEKPILLVGHLDTVFPPGAFESGLVSQGSYLCGPGVADMKGGVVVILGGLWTLDRLGLLENIPLLLAFNGVRRSALPDQPTPW